MIMKREEEYEFNVEYCGSIAYWLSKNSVRAIADFLRISFYEDVSALWVEVQCLCTIGVMTNADPEKVQQGADSRFIKVHQFNNESVTAFYDILLSSRSLCVDGGW